MLLYFKCLWSWLEIRVQTNSRSLEIYHRNDCQVAVTHSRAFLIVGKPTVYMGISAWVRGCYSIVPTVLQAVYIGAYYINVMYVKTLYKYILLLLASVNGN